MLSSAEIPSHILSQGVETLNESRVVPLGRPRRISKFEEIILDYVDDLLESEEYVFPFVQFRALSVDKMSAYKRALLQVQDESSLFYEALLARNVSVYKQGNKVMLWKRKQDPVS